MQVGEVIHMKDIYFKEFFADSPIAYAVLKACIDENGYFYDSWILDVNDAYCRMMNVKYQDILGMPYKDVFSTLSKDETAKWEYACSIAFLDRKNSSVDMHMEWNDTWLRIKAFPLEEDTFAVILIDVTSEYKLEIAQEALDSLMVLFKSSPLPITIKLNGKYVEVDSAFVETMGYEKNEIEKSLDDWKNICHEAEKEMIENSINEYLSGMTGKFELTHRLRHKSGEWRWILTRGEILKDSEGVPYRFVGTIMDITDITIERQKSEELERFFSVTSDLISFSDIHGKYVKLNKAWTDLLGYSKEDVINRKFLDFVHPDDINETIEISRQFVIEREISGFINRIRCKDGTYKSLEWNSKVYGSTIYSAARDVTEKLEREKRVEYLSYHDVLTGLFNRRFMEEEIKRLDKQRNLPISIIMGDVNKLKLMNDAFGHEKGDELLIKSASAIQRGCRSGDLIARWGGDEFMIYLPSTGYGEAQKVVLRILENCSVEDVCNMDVSISFGLATKTCEDERIPDIMKLAEEEMYKMKRSVNHHARGEIIDTIQSSLFKNDSNEEEHAKRVANLCRKTGLAMGLDEATVNRLYLSGMMHDIGKIAIKVEILEKPGALSDDEVHEIMRHAEIGSKIVSTTQDMMDVGRIILSHHERLDGKGYPSGLGSDEISLESKIIAIAESFDSMTSNHPYRKGRTVEDAVGELRRNEGSQFDPEITELFIEKVAKESKKIF
jgi:diguanylate cyclase